MITEEQFGRVEDFAEEIMYLKTHEYNDIISGALGIKREFVIRYKKRVGQYKLACIAIILHSDLYIGDIKDYIYSYKDNGFTEEMIDTIWTKKHYPRLNISYKDMKTSPLQDLFLHQKYRKIA